MDTDQPFFRMGRKKKLTINVANRDLGLPIGRSGFRASKKLFLTLAWPASLAQVRSSMGAHRLTLPNRCSSLQRLLLSVLCSIWAQDQRCCFSQRARAGESRRKQRVLCSNSPIAPRRLPGRCEMVSSDISVLELHQVLFPGPHTHGVTPAPFRAPQSLWN